MQRGNYRVNFAGRRQKLRNREKPREPLSRYFFSAASRFRNAAMVFAATFLRLPLLGRLLALLT